jgi:hypothetical protein
MKRRSWIKIPIYAWLIGPIKWGAAQGVDSADALNKISAHLGAQAVVKGQFEQQKKLKGFKRALVSRGDFLISPTHGIVWHTQEPFTGTLIATAKGLISRQADGSISQKISAQQEPGIRAVNETLSALMSGQVKSLAQRFRIDAQWLTAPAQVVTWRMNLVPHEAALAPWVSRIELEGNRFVDMVRLYEAQGDSSLMRLSGQTSALQLTPEDTARFE